MNEWRIWLSQLWSNLSSCNISLEKNQASTFMLWIRIQYMIIISFIHSLIRSSMYDPFLVYIFIDSCHSRVDKTLKLSSSQLGWLHSLVGRASHATVYIQYYWNWQQLPQTTRRNSGTTSGHLQVHALITCKSRQHFAGNRELFPVWRRSFRNVSRALYFHC